MSDNDPADAEDGAAPSDSPVEGTTGASVADDDPHKAEKLTAPSVDGELDEVTE